MSATANSSSWVDDVCPATTVPQSDGGNAGASPASPERAAKDANPVQKENPDDPRTWTAGQTLWAILSGTFWLLVGEGLVGAAGKLLNLGPFAAQAVGILALVLVAFLLSVIVSILKALASAFLIWCASGR